MRARKRLHDRPLPAHPYRDSALVYGTMALVLVIVAALTGGDVVRALVVASAFFVVATPWSWWRFRTRIKAETAAQATRATQDDDPDRVGGGEATE